MKDVCLHCHTPDYVNNFYTQYDGLVTLFTRATGVHAIVVRGKPRQQAEIHHNWFLNPDRGRAFRQSNAMGNVELGKNKYGKE